MVAADRLSAFDVIMGEPIPGKGELLTQMALFWFDKLGHICPNHLTGEAPESVVTPAEVPQVTGRSMLVKRLKPVLIERSEEHTSELQSHLNLVCRLLLEKKNDHETRHHRGRPQS